MENARAAQLPATARVHNIPTRRIRPPQGNIIVFITESGASVTDPRIAEAPPHHPGIIYRQKQAIATPTTYNVLTFNSEMPVWMASQSPCWAGFDFHFCQSLRIRNRLIFLDLTSRLLFIFQP